MSPRALPSLAALLVACTPSAREDAAAAGSAAVPSGAVAATGSSARGAGSGTAALASAASGAPSAAATPSATVPARAPVVPLTAGARIAIPAGASTLGSEPGEAGRQPALEPRPTVVELGPFEIDRLPYPNDPAAAPLTGVDRETAARRCAERGARLCTEAEWERACRGPAGEVFASGAAWSPACAAPTACASGFDVAALGALREWTASEVRGATPGPALRGAAADEPAEARRCAARRVATEALALDVGFRCCHGPPNAAALPEPRGGPAFSPLKLDAARLTALLAEDPTTAALAREVVFFREPDAVNAVISRGPGDRQGFDFTAAPLRWSPETGAEFAVVTARSGKDTSFVLVYWVLAEDRYRLASSFVMKSEPGPVALAYSESIRPRLHFSTCWGCSGETGKVLFRPPERAVIVQP